MNDTAARDPQPRPAPPRTTPVLACTIKLNTDFAQRVYKRTWDRLKGDLYVLTVRTRSNGMEEAAKAIETILSEAFGSARKDLDEELARTDTLIDDVKLAELPEYEGALETQAKFSTPRAKEYLNLILKLDQLLMRYDALWLAGFIETQPRVQRSYNWQRRLIKIANRLRELGNRTRVGLARENDKRTVIPATSSPNAADRAHAAPGGESAERADSGEDPALEPHADEHSAAQAPDTEDSDAEGADRLDEDVAATPADGTDSSSANSDAPDTDHATNGASVGELSDAHGRPADDGHAGEAERAVERTPDVDTADALPAVSRRRRKSALAAASER